MFGEHILVRPSAALQLTTIYEPVGQQRKHNYLTWIPTFLPPMADPTFSEKGITVRGSVSHASSSFEPPFDRGAEKRLLRRLDIRIIPLVWFLFLVNFVDR